VKQLREEWRGQGEVHALGEEASRGAWDALIGYPRERASCVFKANLLPSAVAMFCRAQRKLGDFAIRAHAASGIILGYGRLGLTVDDAGTMLKKWRQQAAEAQGNVIVADCPPDWKRSLDVWGPESEETWLMREVKNQFDRRGIFNPGRFVGGI
jgi:FAD/FMN-containing dehydrogenase